MTAWIADDIVKVAFAFHIANGRVSEIELIADPEALVKMAIVRLPKPRTTADPKEKLQP
ncbi:MAG: hypothetical protein R2706_05480 [Acidimicrobiales bacterium]